MKRLLFSCATVLVCGSVPLLAQASDGYVTAGVSMRAGPDSSYPRVEYVRAGEPVEVVGCLEDYSWCDVIAYDERGWVRADYIEYEYEGRRVLVPEYGPQIGLSIVAFSLGSYWDSHYSHGHYGWYGQRSYWSKYAYSHPHNYSAYSQRGYSTPYRSGNYVSGSRTYDPRYGTARTDRYVAPQTRTDYRANAQVRESSRTTYQEQQAQRSTAARAASANYERGARERAQQQRELQTSQAQAREQRQVEQNQQRVQQQARAEQAQARVQRQEQQQVQRNEQAQARVQRQEQQQVQRTEQAQARVQRQEQQQVQRTEQAQARMQRQEQQQVQRNERAPQQQEQRGKSQQQYAKKKNDKKDDG
jgi:uncharacterized protein YraI